MLRRRKFGDLPDGTSVDVITLGGPGSRDSIEAHVLTYGCVIASLAVPDARGVMANVVLSSIASSPTSTRLPTLARSSVDTRTASHTRDSRSTAASIAYPQTHHRIIFTEG